MTPDRFAYAAESWRAFGDVRLALDDRAVLYGDTAFETLRVERGVALFWRAHRTRLARSLALLGFPARARLLGEADAAVAGMPRVENGVLRVTLSRGEGRGLRRQSVPATYASLHVIAAQEPPARVRLAVVDAPRAAKSGVFAAKHGNYAFAAACLARAAAGFDDVAFCAGKERVYETSAGNLFIAKRRLLATPPADGTILAGTTREQVFRLAKKLGFRVVERAFAVKDVLACDEAFVTSAIVGFQHVSHFGKKRLLGDGAVTRALFHAYRGLVEQAIERQAR